MSIARCCRRRNFRSEGTELGAPLTLMRSPGIAALAREWNSAIALAPRRRIRPASKYSLSSTADLLATSSQQARRAEDDHSHRSDRERAFHWRRQASLWRWAFPFPAAGITLRACSCLYSAHSSERLVAIVRSRVRTPPSGRSPLFIS